MINNHSNKILKIFYITSSLLANFYDCKYFLLVNFVTSLRDRHFFKKKDHRTSLIVDFFELKKHFRDNEVWNVDFYYWLVIKFIMTQHSCVYKNLPKRFYWFDLFSKEARSSNLILKLRKFTWKTWKLHVLNLTKRLNFLNRFKINLTCSTCFSINCEKINISLIWINTNMFK